MSFHSVLSKFPFSSWSFPPLKNHYYYYLTTSKDARSFATVRIELMMEKAFKAHRDLLLLPWHRHSYYYRRQRHQPFLWILFLCLRLPSSSSMILHQLSWLHRWNQWSRYRRRWYQTWPITERRQEYILHKLREWEREEKSNNMADYHPLISHNTTQYTQHNAIKEVRW